MALHDLLRIEGINLEAMKAEIARLTKENQKLEEEAGGLKRRLGELEKEGGALKRQIMRALEALDPRNRW